MSGCCARLLLRPKLLFLVLTISVSVISLDHRASAQTHSGNPALVQPRDRVTAFIDDERRISLPGNRHPQALARNDAGVVSRNFRMERMLLTLLPDAAQQQSLS